jgi:hypothetical protein
VLWPDGVYHDAESTTARSLRESPSPSAEPTLREFLVYSDMDAFRSWATEGATTENADQVLHVFVEPSSLTFVVHTKSSPVATTVSQIMTDLALRRVPLSAEHPPVNAFTLDAGAFIAWYKAMQSAFAGQRTGQALQAFSANERRPSDAIDLRRVGLERYNPTHSGRQLTGSSAKDSLGNAHASDGS